MRGATDAPHLDVRDILNGALAEVWFTFPDGTRMNCMHTISCKMSFEKEKKQVHVLGVIQAGNKALGAKLSGTLSFYDVTSKFRETLQHYMLTGEDMYGEMQVINVDNTSRTGRQAITYYGVNIDNADLSNVDINATELQGEMAFTFEDFNIDESFTDLDGLF